jgi:hypothetical protein
MNFRLKKEATGPTMTRFYVMDASNSIVGTINVGNEQAADLAKHWRSPAPATAPAAKAATKADASRAAIVSAFKKGPRLSKAALLRA